MCAVSLQYDQHNAAAIKMLEAIIAAGLFTISPTIEPFSKEQLDAEIDLSELDVVKGHLISAETMSTKIQNFVSQHAS